MLYFNGEDKLESLTRVDSVAESEKYKRIVQIQIAFYVALSLILILFGIKRIAICLICGVLLPAILQLPCVIKNNILDKVSRKS